MASASWTAILTLIIFFPSQLALEGNLTERPREVNLVLLFCLTALLSIPFAINPPEAWATFNDTFIKAVLIFIVIVNVVRTERRLRGLFFLTLAVSCVISFNAVRDYSAGNVTVEGYRVGGSIGGMFGNPNDMALHLVTVIPIAVALGLSARNVLMKVVYWAAAVLLVAATTVTYSRGGFLGLIFVAIVLAWKLGRRNRLAVMLVLLVGGVLFVALAPGNYGMRLASIFVPDLDPNSSRGARRNLLQRSILVALRYPLFGVGMNNFHYRALHEQVSHNAYTQVASEMGLTACVVYVKFLLTPLKRLRLIERATLSARKGTSNYYLAVGLQASIVGYMVTSFFASVAYYWYVYYLIGYAVCFRRLYESQTGVDMEEVIASRKAARAQKRAGPRAGEPALAGAEAAGAGDGY
jgi:O-antigen ligase